MSVSIKIEPSPTTAKSGKGEMSFFSSDSFSTVHLDIVFRCGAISQSDLNAIPSRIEELMGRIRPHAVNLVDSWEIPDYLLDR